MKPMRADRLLVVLVAAAALTGAFGVASAKRDGAREPASELSSIRGFSWEEVGRSGLEVREASYYRRYPDDPGLLECLLCPRACLLAEGQRGYCKVRVNLDSTLYTLAYGNLVALHNDPIEKKPLYHFLPGERALSVATAGCNLGCLFCQNWSISQSYPEDARFTVLSPLALVDLAERHECATIAYTYSEPSVFYEYMMDCARAAHERSIRNIWVTAGYINPEPLRELCRYLDAANVDLKSIREEYYREYCDGHLQPVLTALRILKQEGVYLEVTNLLVPGGNDSEADIRDLCRWVTENLGPDTVLHFSRYFPAYRLQLSPTPEHTMLRAREIAWEEGLHHVYIGNLPGPGYTDTRCPSCDRVVVRRDGYVVTSFDIVDGRCPYCGSEIHGVWH